MGTGYTRNDTTNNISDGNIINASDLDGEFDAIESAFNGSTGHSHDGSTGEGPIINVFGDSSNSISISSAALIPNADDTIDLGSSGAQFKDLHLDGTANIDSLVADTADINGGTLDGVTIGGSSAAAGAFTTLTASGDVNFDSNTLFVDASANAVGIGTSNPDNLVTIFGGDSGHSWSYDSGDLLIIEDNDSVSINIATPASNSGNILFSDANARGQGRIAYTHSTDAMQFMTGGVGNTRMTIDSSGSVTIGDATYGSSLGQLRIINDASSAPASLSLFGHNDVSDGNDFAKIEFAMQTAGTGGNVVSQITSEAEGTSENAAHLTFETASSGSLSEVMRLTSGKLVGIGQSSPSTTLSVRGGSANGIELDEDLDNSTDSNRLFFTTSAGSNSIRSQSGNLRFTTGATAGSSSGTTRMTLDTSGNLLVGKESSDYTTTGSEINDGGMIIVNSSTSTNLGTNSGANILLVNSSATDGNFSNIGSYNDNQLVDSQINFIHESHSSRTGAIGFSTHDGSALTEHMRIESDGDIKFPISTNAMGLFSDSIGEVGTGNFALQVSNTAQSALKPFGIRAEDIRFATGSSERLRIDSAGALQLGGTTNAGFIDFNGTSLQLNTQRNPNTGAFVNTGASHANITLNGASGGSSILFYTASANNTTASQTMTLDENGNLGLGTTDTASARLRVEGGSNSATSPILDVLDADGSVEGGSTLIRAKFSGDTSYSNAYYLLMQDSDATQGIIYGTGNGTVTYQTSSDERRKQNISDTASKWATVKALQVRDYEWISTGNSDTGFIAQELNAHCPSAVKVGGDDVAMDPWMVDYGRLTPILTKALQEAMAKIETLEAKVAALENA